MLFNLVALLALGSVAERLLGPGRTIVTFFAIGVLAQLPALAWQPVGAGNSVANFGLAGSIAVVVLRARPARPIAAAALLALVTGTPLFAAGNIHGVALAMGALAGLIAEPLSTTGRGALARSVAGKSASRRQS
jgi:rhomboid protease GluP